MKQHFIALLVRPLVGHTVGHTERGDRQLPVFIGEGRAFAQRSTAEVFRRPTCWALYAGVHHAALQLINVENQRLRTEVSCGKPAFGTGSEGALDDCMIGTAARDAMLVAVAGHLAAALDRAQDASAAPLRDAALPPTEPSAPSLLRRYPSNNSGADNLESRLVQRVDRGRMQLMVRRPLRLQVID